MEYTAFVSSTYEDLKDHRTHVISELRRSGFSVNPMEEWTADTGEPKQFSRERVHGCDLCILLVGFRRGHVPQGEQLSITQMELHEAETEGIDVLVYLLSEDAPWRRKFDERDDDDELVRWRSDLSEHKGVEFFDLKAESIKIAPALTRWIAGRSPSFDETPAAPATKGDFVGRKHSLTALKRLVEEEVKSETGQRPIVLVGMGGVGKTRLAHELIRQLVDRYPGGELRMERPRGVHRKPARAVFSEWANEMGLPVEREYNATEIRYHLAAHYLDRPRICLIDDADKDDIVQIEEINEALPADWTRLITTRDGPVSSALGARHYPVRGMSDLDSMLLIRDRLHFEFDERSADGAVGVDRAFEQHEEALEAFVDKVDGLPLALRLGIGTCRSLPDIPKVVQRLVDSLKGGVESFRAGAFDAADKDHSLAASLTVSLENLERDSKTNRTDWADRFRGLGVLPDGCKYDSEFLMSVWGDRAEAPAGDEALDALVRSSLLEQNVDSGLYSIQPVLRSFAEGSLADDQVLLETTRQRYHRVVVDRAKQSYEQTPERWTAPDDLYPHGARVLETLMQSLKERTSVSFDLLADPEVRDWKPYEILGSAGRNDVALGAELANAFKRAVSRRPSWGAVGTRLLQLGLICRRSLEDHCGSAEYLSRLGTQHATRRPERAEQYFAAATTLARERDCANLGRILTHYAEMRRKVADAESSLELAREALEIHQRKGDERLIAHTRSVIGETFWRLLRLDEAEAEHRRALEIYKRIGDRQGVADQFNKLGSVEFNRGGRYEQAIGLFESALAEHEALNDRVMKAEDLNDLGASYRYLGRYDEAEARFKQALELNEATGNRRLQAINICNIAGTLYAQQQYDLAQQRAEEGRRLGEKVEARVPQLWGLVWEGLAWQGMGELDKAERFFRDAVDCARSFDSPRGLAGALARLGSLLIDEQGRPAEGALLIDEAIALLVEHKARVAFSNVTMAELEERRRRVDGPTNR